MAEQFKNKIVEHSKESGDIYSWIYSLVLNRVNLKIDGRNLRIV